MNLRTLTAPVALLLLGLAAGPAHAVKVKVYIENVAPADSVATSPFTLAAHDGSFDAFDLAASASLGIENVAELGDGGELINEALATQPSAVTDVAVASNGGFMGAIFSPGSSGHVVLDLDPSIHRYLTFGAMVVPSNDAFFANASPTEVELFDAGGNFVAADFTLTGADIWDAGTEVNQLLGSAYVVGQNAMLGDDEMGTVTAADLAALFGAFTGETTPNGPVFNTVPTAGLELARFTFSQVPEPATLLLVASGLVAVGLSRSRTA